MSLDYSSICNIGSRIDRMGVDEGNLQVMGVERYILSSSSCYGVEVIAYVQKCFRDKLYRPSPTGRIRHIHWVA